MRPPAALWLTRIVVVATGAAVCGVLALSLLWEASAAPLLGAADAMAVATAALGVAPVEESVTRHSYVFGDRFSDPGWLGAILGGTATSLATSA